ncbi:MAG: 5-formyltetrahydrofolate cyclo-ligase [Moraxellaceae bacterium]|nr:5-formyltetrahydrofolate cyclo-ligase [Moraxellaceae bacterium]
MKFNRRYFTKQRRALSARQRRQLAKKASFHLYKLHHRLPKNAKIAIYYDDFGELPTQMILDWCLRYGYSPYLPIVGSLTRGDKRLRFAPIYHKKLCSMPSYRHALGMKQIKTKKLLWANQLDAIFCPLVAIDKTGTRMGMGGGYYDRSLAKSHQFSVKKPLTIAWCYDFQCVDKLERNAWDIPMDMTINPNKIIYREMKTCTQQYV